MSDNFDFEMGSEPEKKSSGGETILDRLRETLQKEVSRPDIEVRVPTRKGIRLRFTPNITREQLRKWMKNSGSGTKNGTDDIKFACYVTGSTLKGIYLDGELVVDDNDVALGFASPAIKEMVGEERLVPDVIQAFFGDDGILLATASTILDNSGFGVEVAPEDSEEDGELNPTMP